MAGYYGKPFSAINTPVTTTPTLRVYGNSIGAKPHLVRRLRPFVKGCNKIWEECNPVSETGRFTYPPLELLIRHLSKSSPVYADALREEALTLLLAGQAVHTSKFYSGRMVSHLIKIRVIEVIPPAFKKSKARFFLSHAGFALVDYWAERYKRFRPYRDLFIPKKSKVRALAAQFFTERLLGATPFMVEQIEKHNLEISTAEAQENAAVYQRQQAAMQQNVYPYGPLVYVAADPTVVWTGGTGVSTSTTLNINNPVVQSSTWTGRLGWSK